MKYQKLLTKLVLCDDASSYVVIGSSLKFIRRKTGELYAFFGALLCE